MSTLMAKILETYDFQNWRFSIVLLKTCSEKSLYFIHVVAESFIDSKKIFNISECIDSQNQTELVVLKH